MSARLTTHCRNGHPITKYTLRVKSTSKGPQRQCRICESIGMKRRRAAKLALQLRELSERKK